MIDFEDKTDKKLEKIIDKISSIDSTLAAQHVVLDEHIRRTEALEKRVVPIESNMLIMQGFLKFLGMPISLLMVIAAVTEILSYLRK
jgi:hypothetical protein